MTIPTCRICTLSGNDKLQTALGVSPVCHLCFENHAETPATLHQAAIEAHRTKVAIPQAIKRRITIHIGDNQYLPIKEWEAKQSQIPCVCDYAYEAEPQDDEADEINARIMALLKRNKSDEEFEKCLPHRVRKPGLFTRIRRSVKAYFEFEPIFVLHNPTR